jgi:hypothetical protein
MIQSFEGRLVLLGSFEPPYRFLSPHVYLLRPQSIEGAGNFHADV